MDAQLKHGILPFCILKLIQRKDQYGYNIVKKIQQYFKDTDESTVYTILRRLYKEGLTETYLGNVSNGPSRKYYRITAQGEERLRDYVQSWKEIMAIMEQLDNV